MFTRSQRIRFSLSAIASALAARFALHAVDLKDPDVIAAIEAAVTEATDKLALKNAELVKEKRALQAKAGTGVDSAELERVERERDEWKGKAETATRDLKKVQTDLTTATEALTGEKGYTQKLLVDNGLTAALVENGVKNPAHLKAALALIRSSSGVEVKVDGENRTALVGGKPLGEFVKTWAASDDGKHFVTAAVNTGTNANGGKPPVPGDPAAMAAAKPVDRMHAAREAQAAAAAKT